jgi:hypothetical protein
VEKKEQIKRGTFEDDFAKKFESACKKAGTTHRHDLDKAKYDLDTIKSGQGGFTEPDDDGIEP